jgi:hypothetical protein
MKRPPSPATHCTARALQRTPAAAPHRCKWGSTFGHRACAVVKEQRTSSHNDLRVKQAPQEQHMKHTQDTFDPGERQIPGDWIARALGTGAEKHGTPAEEPHKWLTTLAAPLATVRTCALEALAEMNADLAYRYETDEKVVIRSTLPQRQIRAELKPLEGDSTRIVVVTLRGAEVDRITSGRLVDAIERKLEDAGYPVHA